MLLEIKHVKACLNGAYGNFILKGRERALVTVSMKLNGFLSEYTVTLLHELLHFWFTMLRKQGFKATNRQEHKFIYAMEDRTIEELKKHFKRKK